MDPIDPLDPISLHSTSRYLDLTNGAYRRIHGIHGMLERNYELCQFLVLINMSRPKFPRHNEFIRLAKRFGFGIAPVMNDFTSRQIRTFPGSTTTALSSSHSVVAVALMLILSHHHEYH